MNIELTTNLSAHMTPAVPIVPTTNQEARAGWDALYKLGSGYWYFLQYKVAAFATRRTSWNKGFWDFHGGPYFRFVLHPDSVGECRQHRLLVDLRGTQPGVYYCSPNFVKADDLWKRAKSGSIFADSQLIDLADVILPTYHGRHQVSYDASGLVRPWSEPGQPTKRQRTPEIRRGRENRREMSVEAVAGLLVDATRVVADSQRSRGSFETWIGARMPEQILGPVREASRMSEPRNAAPGVAELLPPAELLAVTSRILRLDFGLTWFIEP